MSVGIVGKKIGMTQVFDKDGIVAPVTIIEAGPCVVVQVKNLEKDGYSALKVAYGDVKKEKNFSNPYKGIFKKLNIPLKKYMREFRADALKDYQPGQEIKADLFKQGDYVDVTGVSKGKGFAGTIKRHGFHGLPSSHGNSEYRRHPGSIGASSFPSRVFKGMRMAGHMGSVRRTAQKLEVVFVDAEKNLLMLKGSVPGPNESIVIINQTVKKLKHIKPKQVLEAKEDKQGKKPAKKPK